MGRKRAPGAAPVVYRTARCGLRVTRGQRRRLFGLLRSAGDVWCCVLELNGWRRRRQDRPLASYQELCRELAASGSGTFGELDSAGARSVLRRYCDAWFAAARRRKGGDLSARFPRRRRGMVPVRWYAGTFKLDGRVLRLPVAKGCPPLMVRLDRDVPYPAGQVRSVTLLFDGRRLQADVTAEVPVTAYPGGLAPGPERVAGIDLGIIHPYAVAGPDGQGLLVSGRAVRAECRLHLRDSKARTRAAARRAPKPGQRGSRRWRQHRRSQRAAEARHARRVRQAQHEARRSTRCPSTYRAKTWRARWCQSSASPSRSARTPSSRHRCPIRRITSPDLFVARRLPQSCSGRRADKIGSRSAPRIGHPARRRPGRHPGRAFDLRFRSGG